MMKEKNKRVHGLFRLSHRTLKKISFNSLEIYGLDNSY